ncbi:glycosyltransferase family 4 protein [Rosistilla carotiformis]|nr:glycosyltransferase family 4 protein [Rosistilla carotiformis]
MIHRVTGWFDVGTYNHGLVNRMQSSSRQGEGSNLSLWMGDFVRGRVVGVPSVGYLQGPPATDARSIARHRDLIIRLAGWGCYLKLRAYAAWRMGVGYPDLSLSDYLIVGSQWSRSDLIIGQRCDPDRVYAIPYPIDLAQFQPSERARETTGRLKLLWLGRFVPRKRLDLFLDGLELAIRGGCDVEALVIGRSGFVPNYEQLLDAFPFPDRLRHRPSIPRSEVPGVLTEVDVMAQPSDDENFGSSVAEALACGVPTIVGATNGTGDYICPRSIRLADDKPETMAAAIVAMADAKKRGELVDPGPSRGVAELHFDPEKVTDQLEAVLKLAVESRQLCEFLLGD